jgi:DNA polymerase-3 subunit chi
MADSAATSDSAGSNDAKPSPRDSSGDRPGAAEVTEAALRVDFYVLDAASSSARLRLACRLAEKAYLSGQSALVLLSGREALSEFDDLLWTFMDGSFVPHDVLVPGLPPPAAPVWLSSGTPPPGTVDLIINLAPDIPACLAMTRRVVEIIDGDDPRRRAGRLRFKGYRDLGVNPATHNIRATDG